MKSMWETKQADKLSQAEAQKFPFTCFNFVNDVSFETYHEFNKNLNYNYDKVRIQLNDNLI